MTSQSIAFTHYFFKIIFFLKIKENQFAYFITFRQNLSRNITAR